MNNPFTGYSEGTCSPWGSLDTLRGQSSLGTGLHNLIEKGFKMNHRPEDVACSQQLGTIPNGQHHGAVDVRRVFPGNMDEA